MNHISISNPDLTKQEYTELSTAAVAGSAVALAVENNQGFAADDLLVIPQQGNEKSELCQVSSVADNNTITVATLKFAHLARVKIVKTPYDQVIIYSSTTEDGTYSAVGTWVDINFDDLVTYIDDVNGSASTWYKAEYRNSVSGLDSNLSTAFQITADVHYCTLNQILEEAGMMGNRFIAPERVSRLRANAESEVKGSIGSIYSLPLSEVPETVRDATKLLAAGRLLWQEFGSDAIGTVNDGSIKIKASRELLKDIRDGSIILLDGDDTGLAKAGVRAISGYPDATTADKTTAESGGKVNFRISQKF